MADADQFILAITNEAMDKVCYETTGGDSGWNLRPFQFAITETDVLAQYTDDQIFNADGTVKDEIYDYLQTLTTKDLEKDVDNIWCELPFSGVTKIGVNNEGEGATGFSTLSHHIVIPADLTISGETKQIRSIYYIYMDNRGIPFLYAVARANNYMIYEAGLTQKYFFDFTVANAYALKAGEFVVNYSYPLEIQDHNNSADAHEDLVKRDGSRVLTGLLNYSQDHTSITQPTQLVDKAYIDKIINETLKPYMDQIGTKMESEIGPAGSMIWWPGTIDTIPNGWCIRDGRELSIAENPKLYALLGNRYGSASAGKFKIMDDRGVFIRGSETSGSSVVNNNYLEGVDFGQLQDTAAPNITGQSGTLVTNSGATTSGAIKTLYYGGAGIRATRSAYRQGAVGIDASLSSSVYKTGVKEARPRNRNYLPLIRLG